MVLLLLAAPTGAVRAERIHAALSPDVTGVPRCAQTVFEIDMETPRAFPSPIPQYALRYAQVDVPKLRALTAQYGMKAPEGERFLNGPDDMNSRNFVFCEENAGRYQLFSYPWGARTRLEGHPQRDKLRAAQEVCRSFLEQAGIGGVEEPYYIVQRTGGRGHLGELSAGNSLGENPPPDEYDGILAREDGLADDEYTGIGFRYTLGGLPVAVQALRETQDDGSFADAWGQMTVRDDGAITAFELWNVREIDRELEAYAGPVCPWERAVDAAVEAFVRESRADDDVCLRLRVSEVEPGLAVTAGGTTFPVWMICLETEEIAGERHTAAGEHIYLSRTAYVDARTGEIAEGA